MSDTSVSVKDENDISTTKLREQMENFDVNESTETISYKKASKLLAKNPKEMWAIVKMSSDKNSIPLQPTKERKGWKTIRIFVSSTFRDFHQEREVLVKEVFPDLRIWCEQRKLRLVECDLRWGVPPNTASEETIKICLQELDRCYKDNAAPFFLNLAGDRAGWIPNENQLNEDLAALYGWVYGLTMTEMEIVHGAFRKLNPNALFMIRKSIKGLPDKVKEAFSDTDPMLIEKLSTLKNMIKSTFPETNIYSYDVEKVIECADGIEFTGLRGSGSYFSQTVYDFFRDRIEILYPLDPRPEDPFYAQREAQENFIESRSQCVLGRNQLINQIHEYITSETTAAPLMVVGTAGAGKSALMAKCAADAVIWAKENKYPIPSNFKKWRVFFHFVGATPGSADLVFFLRRLMKEIKPDVNIQGDDVTDLESLIQLSAGLLSNPNTEPVILFIDAVNQFDADKQQFMSRWLPEALPSNVKVIVSTIESTVTHRMLRAFSTSPMEVICGPLDRESRKEIVKNIFSQYNKRLDISQMDILLNKKGSSNPLWLTLACEELRVFGSFEKLEDKIHSLPDALIDIEMDVLTRFENETGGNLMVATLCLLNVSRHGLLEIELLALLGDENNIKPPEFIEGEGEAIIAQVESQLMTENEDFDIFDDETNDIDGNADITKDKEVQDVTPKEKRQKGKQIKFLPAREWAIIYRNLKPILRPFGDLGEGRLDFYHQSLSEAVKKKYFSGTDEYVTHIYNYWHGVLAGYFETVDDMDRKAEELPYHLEFLMDENRLIQCLREWPIFNRLFSKDFSIDLLYFWQKAGGYSVASAIYKESCKVLRESGMNLGEYADQIEKVIYFLIRAGQYNDAYEILEERKRFEEEHLGSRPDKMAELYHLKAKSKSEEVTNYEFVNFEQFNEHTEIVEYCRKSLEARKQLSGDEHEFKAATINILLSFHLCNMAHLMLKQGQDYREKEVDSKQKEQNCREKEQECRWRQQQCRDKEQECREEQKACREKEYQCQEKEQECREKEKEVREKEHECRQKEKEYREKEQEYREKEQQCREKGMECQEKEKEYQKLEEEYRKKEQEYQEKEKDCWEKAKECRKEELVLQKFEQELREKEKECREKEQEYRDSAVSLVEKQEEYRRKQQEYRKKEQEYSKKGQEYREMERECQQTQTEYQEKEQECRKVEQEYLEKEEECREKEQIYLEKELECRKLEMAYREKEKDCRKKERECRDKQKLYREKDEMSREGNKEFCMLTECVSYRQKDQQYRKRELEYRDKEQEYRDHEQKYRENEHASRNKEQENREKEQENREKERKNRHQEKQYREQEHEYREQEQKYREQEQMYREKEQNCREEERANREIEHKTRENEQEYRVTENENRNQEQLHREQEQVSRELEQEYRKQEHSYREKESEYRKEEQQRRQIEHEHRGLEQENRENECTSREKEHEYRKTEQECRKKEHGNREKEQQCREREQVWREKEEDYRKKEQEYRRAEQDFRKQEQEYREMEQQCRLQEQKCREREQEYRGKAMPSDDDHIVIKPLTRYRYRNVAACDEYRSDIPVSKQSSRQLPNRDEYAMHGVNEDTPIADQQEPNWEYIMSSDVEYKKHTEYKSVEPSEHLNSFHKQANSRLAASMNTLTRNKTKTLTSIDDLDIDTRAGEIKYYQEIEGLKIIDYQNIEDEEMKEYREMEQEYREQEQAYRELEQTYREKEQECREKELEYREKEQECREKEQEYRDKQRECREKEKEYRQMEQRCRELEREYREKEQEYREKEQESLETEREYRQQERIYREKEQEYRNKEQEWRLKEQQYREQEQVYRKKEQEYRDKEQEHREKEKEYREKEQECRLLEQECRDKEQEYRKKEQQFRKEEQEFREKEQEYRDKEQEYRDKEQEYREMEDEHREKEQEFRENEQFYREEEQRYRQEEQDYRDQEQEYREQEQIFRDEEQKYRELRQEYREKEQDCQGKEKEYRIEAFACVDSGIAIFDKIGDTGNKAVLIMTKALIYPRTTKFFEEKKELLSKALDLCQKAYGENHFLACRIYQNIGILYEDNEDFEEAYDKFVMWDECCSKVLGADHPKSKLAKKTLSEKKYIEIKQRREMVTAGSA